MNQYLFNYTMNIDSLIAEYKELCRLTDERVQALEGRLSPVINCKPGCHDCCTLSSVLPLEAMVMGMAIAKLNEQLSALIRLQAKADSPSCPLLHNGLCLIYENRPLICRSHGVPIAYIDYERQAIEVSACPLNFAADFPIEETALLEMDELNRRLHRLNKSLSGKTGPRQKISDIILRHAV